MPRGELYPGGTMKKEYTLKVNYDDKNDRCEIEEGFNEEEIVFNVDGKDIICPDAMSRCILELDNNILDQISLVYPHILILRARARLVKIYFE